VSDNLLLIVGDRNLSNPLIHGAPKCGSDHDVGLACRDGFALKLAAEIMPEADWIFIADDDLYVITSNVRRILAQYDAKVPITLGITGCGPNCCEDHNGGLCGGGGYAISRAALHAMLHKTQSVEPDIPLSKKLEEAAQDEHLTDGWDDIAMSCVMKRSGIQLQELEGLYGFGPEQQDPHDFFTQAISSMSPMPLSFHLPSTDPDYAPSMMLKIHSMVQTHNEERLNNKYSLIETTASKAHYQRHRQHYVEAVNHHRDVVRMRASQCGKAV